MTFDQLILDMKMQTYNEQNSSNDDENEENEDHLELDTYKDVEVTEAIY
jgi:hypothetical protein